MKRGPKVRPYGIIVKCKRSLDVNERKRLETLFCSKVYGKWAVRNVDSNRVKFIPESEYTISKRYIAKYATREAAQKDIIYSWERVALIKNVKN